nr:hypothetical protein [Tanacetum cinerariifolium]
RDEGVALIGEKEKEKKAEEVKDIDGDAQVKGRQAEIQAEIYQIDMDHAAKVLSIQEDKPEVQEEVDVVTTAKLITEVVTAASTPVSDASTIILAAKPKVPAATPTVELDEEYARKLHEKLNKDIDWDTAIEHVKQKAKEDPYVQRYQVMKKRPQTEAQARRNMIMYLKNIAGFRLDYFKGMFYDDIRPIFEAMFNSNIEFLLKPNEQIEKEENREIETKRKKLNEEVKDVEDLKQHLEIVPDKDDDVFIDATPLARKKVAKRKKLNEEVKDVEDLKQHSEIVPDKDDDVFIDATPLARKVPVVNYQIIQLNNKPRYKIIRADGTHQLYISFITLLNNFDREDLKSLWSIVKERFSTLKPNNFSDDYLLTILRAMFERTDGQDQV